MNWTAIVLAFLLGWLIVLVNGSRCAWCGKRAKSVHEMQDHIKTCDRRPL